MNPQFLISKLTANHTETAWAQAYSTINFYLALSVQEPEESDTPITQIGKETLEKLQREYFSLDEKNLDSIKKAVENTVDSLPKEINLSLTFATNVDSTLYIVIASAGQVRIKRGEKIGIIAKGEPDQVLAFSGPLENGDLILLETQGFAEKISHQLLKESSTSSFLNEIAENLAPHLQENIQGTESAILLQVANPQGELQETAEMNSKEDTEGTELNQTVSASTEKASAEKIPEPELKEEKMPRKEILKDNLLAVLRSLPSPKIIFATLASRKKLLIGLAVLLLLLLLIGSIIAQSRKQESAQNKAVIEKVVADAQSDYDEGVALESFNRPIALEKFSKAKTQLEKAKDLYSKDPEIEKVTTLLAQVNNKMSELSAGKKVENGKVVISAKDAKLENLQTVGVSDAKIVLTDKTNKLSTLDSTGNLKNTYDLKTKSIIDTARDDNFAHLLTPTAVVKVDLGNGRETELFKLDSARLNLALYGSNIYLLNKNTKMVEKYAPSSYKGSDYLNNKNALASTPISFGIDGSVYVLLDNGNLKKFTRGVEEGFNLSRIQGAVSKNAMLSTREGFSSLYILDTTNQRLLIVSKNGEVKQEFSWESFKNATDFAVDEQNKTVYFITPDSLYSFSF